MMFSQMYLFQGVLVSKLDKLVVIWLILFFQEPVIFFLFPIHQRNSKYFNTESFLNIIDPTSFLFSGYACSTWSDITIAGFVVGIQIDDM